MKIEPFEVEQWMDAHETRCNHNLAETCSASLSISSLLSLHPNAPDPLTLLSPQDTQNYGHIRGDPALLQILSDFYAEDVETYHASSTAPEPPSSLWFSSSPSSTRSPNENGSHDIQQCHELQNLSDSKIPPENILITPGAIAANFLVFYALVAPGDHVIVQHPTYQQLYSVPEALDASVSLWRAKGWMRTDEAKVQGREKEVEKEEWTWEFEECERLVRKNTKMIIINNPNNPTGSILSTALLESLVTLASKHNIILLSDEVYRPLFHSLPISHSSNHSHAQPTAPPSLLSLSLRNPYANVLTTGSLSKAFSLAGVRVGWVASRSRDLIERLAAARDYTCISVSQVDQRIAAFALSKEVRPRLLQRNLNLARANLAVLEGFVKEWAQAVDFVRPVAGTTAFLKFRCPSGAPVDSVSFCKTLLQHTGVLFLPGDRGFGDEFKGYVRVGYVPEAEVVRDGFEALRAFMRSDAYAELPPAT